MKDKYSENEQFENLLRRAHLPEPSPQLKQRITVEARKAWNQTAAELPWLIPVRRLVASAAAAVLIIWLANYSSDYSLAQWRSGGPSVARQQLPDLETLPEMPYGPFAKHLVLVGRRSLVIDASALRNYAERVRQILKETQQNGASNEQVPDGGRSRLFPVQPGSDYYS